MPKVKKDLLYTKQYTEEQIKTAVSAAQNGMSQRKASQQYSIPRSTIQDRLNNRYGKTALGPAPVLGVDEENELVQRIIDCSLAERFAEGVTSANSCVSQSDLRKWYKDIHAYLKRENYLDILKDSTRVFNADETYFNVCPKMKNVLALRGSRNVYEIERGKSKLNLTVLFTFNASGVMTPPTLVYPYTRLPLAVGGSVPEGWGIGVTPNGWMNHDLFIEYLVNIFHPYLVKENVEFPVILFVDGHSSHMSLEVSKVCDALKIILICVYPNSTRMIQPADVASFKPIKSLWKKSVLQWRQQNPEKNITLELMAPILKTAIDKFLPEATKNGFRACGLCPWDPDAVDYSKCLAPAKEKTQNLHNVDNSSDTANIPYKSYAEIVGDDLLQKLESFVPEVFMS